MRMLKTKVKASGINSLTDARYFAARGAHWLGFRLEPGADGALSPIVVNAIKEWVDGVVFVGEFEFSSPEQILELQKMVALDVVQAGNFIAPEGLKLPGSCEVIREIVVERETAETALLRRLESDAPHCQAFLLNFQKTGISWEDLERGTSFSIEFLRSVCQPYPIILDIEFDPASLSKALETLPLYGISLNGGAEEKTGLKSFDLLDEIFDFLELPE